MNRSWESQVLQGTTQVKWTTGKMVFEVTRLWLHTIIYSGKNKYQDRHVIKKKPDWYQGRQ